MLGTALQESATKVLLLGAGELGKEVALECQRYGLEVIAVDRYKNAPAMHVAHRSYVIDMLDDEALHQVLSHEKPDYVVPEIEAIATDTLVKLEEVGLHVVPNAHAVKLTMNREGIRCLAAEELGLTTSPYRFAGNFEDFKAAVDAIGMPCVVKPIMSSSGHGQSVIKSEADIQKAWDCSQEGGRAGAGRVIVEGFVDFDYEITLLTVRAIDGIFCCEPIGHRQENGDYRESWQPQAMSEKALTSAQAMAKKAVDALGGYGLFGVEFFVKGDTVIFSEVSPRPHDTGMVTMISQDLSEFALHVRAFLQLPIMQINQFGPSASAVILGNGESNNLGYTNLAKALKRENVQARLFAKPEIHGTRRLGVVIARDESIDKAVEKAKATSRDIEVNY